MVKVVLRSLHLLFIFLMEFLLTNMVIAYTILFKKLSHIKPKIVDFPTPDLSPLKRTLLAHMITLTPGTITCNVDHEKEILRVHILDTDNPEETLEHINLKFTNPLREINR